MMAKVYYHLLTWSDLNEREITQLLINEALTKAGKALSEFTPLMEALFYLKVSFSID